MCSLLVLELFYKVHLKVDKSSYNMQPFLFGKRTADQCTLNTLSYIALRQACRLPSVLLISAYLYVQ